jgi:hypothetical protein
MVRSIAYLTNEKSARQAPARFAKITGTGLRTPAISVSVKVKLNR